MMDGVHWYFPEWADRPASSATASEGEHNSYMAGGYAEEFGYCADAEGPSVFPLLDGDPEQCSLWRVQVQGLHPGYPECARPLDLDRLEDELPPPFGRRVWRAMEDSHARAEVRFTGVRVRRVGRMTTSWWRTWLILRRGLKR